MIQTIDDSVVVFSLGDLRFALGISAVVRVVRAVEILPLSGAPQAVRGVINVQGKILPVFDPRERFGIPEEPITSRDHLIIANTQSHMVALMVDTVEEIVTLAEAEVTYADEILPELKGVSGVMKLDSNLILLYDMNQFLSIADEKALQLVLES